MMTETDFLRSIHETPDDDDLRLVFADWLEDNGDPRGELMRVQVEFARRPGDRELQARNRALLAEHAEGWLGPLRSKIDQFAFVRGTLHLWATGKTLLGKHLEDPAMQAVCRWVEALRVAMNTEEPVAFLENFPHLTRLDFSPSWRLVRGQWEQLVGLPALICLRTLCLTGIAERETLQIITRAASLPRLRSLDLGDNHLGPQAIQELASAANLPALAVLNLRSNNIGEEGMLYLGASPLMRQLQVLDLNQNSLTDNAVRTLVEVAEQEDLPLMVLRLSQNGLDEESLVALTRAPGFSRLAHLEMTGTRVGDMGLQALAASEHLGALTALRLSYTRAGDEGVEALARSPRMSRLTCLELSNCPGVRDDAVIALADSPGSAGLMRLELEGCPLTDEAGWALARSPSLNRITHLRLSSRFGSSVRDALRTRFGGALTFF
jgi:uncharacterized protein (TIGR02996 family)